MQIEQNETARGSVVNPPKVNIDKVWCGYCDSRRSCKFLGPDDRGRPFWRCKDCDHILQKDLIKTSVRK